ncbi:MAG: hypothetical protein ACFFC6_17200, partial [Promethearchaeota archaeon]
MSGKELIGSIAISFIAMGVITLFVLPQLYPAIQTGTDDSDLQSDISNLQDDLEQAQTDISDLQDEVKGIVIQSLYEEFSTTAQILDSDTGSYIPVPDTELEITIQSDSKIAAVFSGVYVLGVSNSLDSDRLSFNIALIVEGAGNRTLRIAYYEMGTYPDHREFSSSFYINYMTDSLAEGTYTISVAWISNEDQPGTTNYLLFTTPA